MPEVRARIDLLKTLDPTPGRKYTEERTSYVVPDISVTKEGEEWKVDLNDEGLPRLRISGYYRQLLAKAAEGQPEAYHFLKDRLKKALWFMRSLDQRNQTIHKVARFIVDRQKEFFEKGIDYIRPLTLMEIAQDIGVHESTVGRVVANKYMMTPGASSRSSISSTSRSRGTTARTSRRSRSRTDPQARRGRGEGPAPERHRDRRAPGPGGAEYRPPDRRQVPQPAQDRAFAYP